MDLGIIGGGRSAVFGNREGLGSPGSDCVAAPGANSRHFSHHHARTGRRFVGRVPPERPDRPATGPGARPVFRALLCDFLREEEQDSVSPGTMASILSRQSRQDLS